MAKEKESADKKLIVKIYLILLFIAGIIIGFSFVAAKNDGIIETEQRFDNDLVFALVGLGVEQTDVLSQYTKEYKQKGVLYHTYYKKIQLKPRKKQEDFELPFKKLAKAYNLELSRTLNDDGSAEYAFSDTGRTISVTVFEKNNDKYRVTSSPKKATSDKKSKPSRKKQGTKK